MQKGMCCSQESCREYFRGLQIFEMIGKIVNKKNFMVKQIWNADESGYPELDSKYKVIRK